MIRRMEMALWLARLSIAIVTAWNLQCAVVFLLNPTAYMPGFELNGLPGQVALRGMAVLFVMWSIPYLVALWNPLRHRLSLWEALAMQLVGLAGESLILTGIPQAYPSLQQSICKFILFDGLGVGLLAVAVLFSARAGRKAG